MNDDKLYFGFTLTQIADLARASNPELGAFGRSLLNYYTGKVEATFSDHEGEGAKETALFLSSAREIVLGLIARINELETAVKPLTDAYGYARGNFGDYGGLSIAATNKQWHEPLYIDDNLKLLKFAHLRELFIALHGRDVNEIDQP